MKSFDALVSTSPGVRARRPMAAPAAAIASAILAACGGGDAAGPPAPPSSTPAAVEVVAGSQQRGLVGRPLADSLVVRVRNAAGTGLQGVAVAWSAAGGALSGASSTTDAQGLARVQWSPGAGDVTASATVPGLTAATFTANGRAGGACQLQPAPATQRFTLGPTDFTLSLRATVPLRVAVLFVDYPDAAATETPASLMTTVVDPGVAMLEEMSYGRIDLTTVAFPTWYRMPQPASAYDWTTYAGHRAFMLDVLAATNAAIDFSTFDALYVFSPPSAKPVSVTFNGGSTANVVADGRNFGNAVTFGGEPRSAGPAIVAHETGHILGLLDLYSFSPAGGTTYPGIPRKHVGSWSIMSNYQNPAHFLGWEKRKLGWLDADQVDCLDGGAGGVEAVLTPLHVAGGRKMVVMPIDGGSALVAEVRASGGFDANLCAAGVLLYTVDARIATGAGPAQVIGSRVTTSGTDFTRCGPWPDATFGTGTGAVATWTDAALGMSVTVVAAEAGGAWRVRVKRTS